MKTQDSGRLEITGSGERERGRQVQIRTGRSDEKEGR